jgi:hypothetical protein
MFTLAALGMAAREWRATITARTKQATDNSTAAMLATALATKIDTLNDAWKELDEKRQKHEVDCARVQERTAATQERLTEILDQHGRAIGNLQSQMSRVATGDAGRMVEFGAVKP